MHTITYTGNIQTTVHNVHVNTCTCTCIPTHPTVPHINNDYTDRDSFDEIYKLTDFDRLL